MSMKELRKKLDATLADMRGQMRLAFMEEARALFDKYPDMNSFGWHQYTPYFNDGEPCRFRVYEWPCKVNGQDEDHMYIQYGDSKGIPEELALALEDVRSLVTTADETTMEEMYGDGQEITINRDGTTKVEFYDHD